MINIAVKNMWFQRYQLFLTYILERFYRYCHNRALMWIINNIFTYAFDRIFFFSSSAMFFVNWSVYSFARAFCLFNYFLGRNPETRKKKRRWQKKIKNKNNALYFITPFIKQKIIFFCLIFYYISTVHAFQVLHWMQKLLLYEQCPAFSSACFQSMAIWSFFRKKKKNSDKKTNKFFYCTQSFGPFLFFWNTIGNIIHTHVPNGTRFVWNSFLFTH